MMDYYPTREMVLRKFRYNPQTGDVTRKVAAGNNKLKIGSKVGCAITGRHGERYIQTKIDRIGYGLHQIIWLMQTGQWPDEVDHINGDGIDNRWCNLRNVSHHENSKNKKRPSDNKSGVIGVSYAPSVGRWIARIGVRGRNLSLYLGHDFFEACCRRKAAELKYGFHENHGR